MAAAAKRPRVAPQPEDLQKGTPVRFLGGRRGIIRDSFAVLDQFWVADENGELVRDEEGEPVQFRSQDLELVTAPAPRDLPAAQRPPGQAETRVRVLLVGNEAQMCQILKAFGPVDITMRRDVQQLLAIPCSSCRCSPACLRFDPGKRQMCEKRSCPILQLTSENTEEMEVLQALAETQRPDIPMSVRPFYLKQALEQIGPDLVRLEDRYCLSAVTVPRARQEINTAPALQRYDMEEVHCQIDIGTSAAGVCEGSETALQAAQRVLGEACGLCLAEQIWSEEAQLGLRQRLGVDIPLKFWDGPETKVFVVLLPENARVSSEGGLLMFWGAMNLGDKGSDKLGNPLKKGGDGQLMGDGNKTIGQWRSEQEQFKDLPKLPPGWIRIKSREDPNKIYYFHTKTQETTFECPLPEGWTKQVSKSNGKAYYFNAKQRKSQYTRPTEP